MAKESFYEASTYTGGLRPGYEIEIRRSISYRGEHADFKPFLAVPHQELEQRLKDSMAAEKNIYDELQKAVKAWDEHGAQTLLLQKAIAYLKTAPVKHTSNEWEQRDDGTWEISNLVYRMTFKIVPRGDEWKLMWELQYTAPGYDPNAYHSYYEQGPKPRIVYAGSKKYKTMAGAQKYIQSKFDQYAQCFETLSPPVPESVKSLFCVNGQLLQGYAIGKDAPAVAMSPEQVKPDKEAVEALLAFLDDEEPPGTPPEQTEQPPAPVRQASRPAPKAAHAKRPRTSKKSRSAAVR